MKVLIIGSAHPLRGGGITTFNHRLAKEFIAQGHDCSIISFSLQYPSFLFPGKSQFTDEPAPEGIPIRSLINSVNPANWLKVGKSLQKERPDLLVVRFWLPFMGPALGTILRLAKKNRHTKVICIADNVIPHEKRPGDRPFTNYFLKQCDAFISMSEKVLKDLRTFEPKKPAKLMPHPLYDNFGTPISQTEAKKILSLPEKKKILLFFGFIRHYKGLDMLLQAMGDERIKRENICLLVAGEFYEDEKKYQQIISDYGLQQSVILRTGFIPDNDVKLYLSAADCVVQPYRNATQSGVTPLAYHFEKPMIVTNVGGLPSLVPHEKAGLVVEPNPQALANAILVFNQMGTAYFIPHLRHEKQKLSWDNLLKAIIELYASLQNQL
ncbi:MAG TPA: glycosyltransferase [Flavisolibacter sp.]|jgi:glycosyltransferase involved in cell wall biosynthesis|nr:glycosyltransferase [Flavisolibacter sp.]